MRDHLLFLLLGTGAGAAYAAIGIGVVLTYRASGVVNLAHGALAMYATYVFVELRTTGDLLLPVVGLPGRLALGRPLATAPALLVASAVAAALGLAIHLVVFRPLRSAPPLAGLVASVGLTIAVQAMAVLRFGTGNRAVPPVLPARPLRMAGVTVPTDRLILAGLVLAAAAGLGAVSRWTRVGLAARAATEDELGAVVTGWSPVTLAAGSWAVAGVLGALAGVLVGPITQLNPVTYSLLVVPAVAAALVGRLASFGLTAAAGIALGMAQSEVVGLQARYPGLPRIGLAAGLPLLVIVVVLAVRGQSVAGRTPLTRTGRLAAAALPRRILPGALAGSAAGIAGLLVLPAAYRLGLVTSMVAALVCLSLVVVTGWAGQVSLAQMAFAGIGGFALSRLAEGAHVPFPLAPLLAAAVAAVAGVAVGWPAGRVRGVSLALVTVAAAVAVEELVFKSASLAGGLAGTTVPPPAIGSLDLGIGRTGGSGLGDYPRPAFGMLVLAVLVVAAAAVAGLRRGRLGRRLLAVRANETAAAAVGIAVAPTKLLAFGLAAFLAGLAGALMGYQQGQLSAESFGVVVSLSFLALASIGGIASVTGALVGGALVADGVVVTAVDRLVGLGRYQLLASGLGLVLVAVAAPDGVTGLVRRATGWVRARAGP